LVIVLFNYAFSTAEVNALSNDMGRSSSMVSVNIGMLVECVSRGQSVEL
jgi:hypothetical protein